jgi:hypothetical protein
MLVGFEIAKAPKGSGGVRYESIKFVNGVPWVIYVPQSVLEELTGSKKFPEQIAINLMYEAEGQ